MRSLATITCVLAVFAVAACGGADPGGGSSDGDAGAGAPTGLGSGDPGGTPTATATDAGRDTGPAAVVEPVVPGTPVTNPTDAWSGSSAYASAPPAIRANDQHPASITGKPCLTCHDGKTCTKFDFAGTIWKYPALTQPAADAEIRIIDAKHLAHSVHADVDGNFWHRADADLPLPAFSGARTATWKAVGTLNGVSCNQCHESGAATPGRLFVH